jgi:4-hydroxybenzoate polyprenyltransferase
MHSAAEVRGEYDLTDVPAIVAGAVRLGLFEAVVVLLFSLASRFLDGPVETIVLALIAFCPLFAALSPLTQIYQLEEDIRRGDRTLATVLGVGGSLDAATAALAVAFALFAAAGVAAGWGPGHRAWRWPVLVLALSGWLAVLLPWRRDAGRLDAPDHQRGMYRALAAWAVTDLAVLVAFGA